MLRGAQNDHTMTPHQLHSICFAHNRMERREARCLLLARRIILASAAIMALCFFL